MKTTPLPPQSVLLTAFRYVPKSGLLIWRTKPYRYPQIHGWRVGRIAGWKEANNRMAVKIWQKTYSIHRIIWKMLHGTEPRVIDHIDGNGYNNRLSNLRAATYFSNNWNRGATTGRQLPKWVFIDRGTIRVKVKAHGQAHYLAGFSDPEEAHAAACKVARRVHGKFFRAA